MFARLPAAGLHLSRLSERPLDALLFPSSPLALLYPEKARLSTRAGQRNALTRAGRICYTVCGTLSPAGRNDGAWLLPSFAQKGVIVVTDYEMLSTFIMILMLVLAVMSYYKNDR